MPYYSLQFHIIIAGGIELILLMPTISLVIGATKRIRCLMLPYLVLFGIAQIFIMASILACVVFLPAEAKPLAIAVTAFEAFVVFPWWYAVIHLFAVFEKNHYHGSYLVYPAPSPSELYQKQSEHVVPYSNSATCNSHTRSMLI